MDANEPRDEQEARARAARSGAAMEQWSTVLDDMEATAAEFDEAGWETVVFHPGDVTTVLKNREPGVDVLLPGDEYDDLAAAIDEGVSFETYEVYRAVEDSMVYAVIVAQDEETSTAALVPVYLDQGKLHTVIEAEREEPGIPLYLRRLDNEMIELRLDDPSLLLDNQAEDQG